MSRNIALCFEYDGTAFVGSQWQAEGRSVQGEVEAAWARLTGEFRRWTFAGRTDAGVHALAQVANCQTETRHGLETIVRALNANSGSDLSIHAAWEMPAGFNARFSARQRSYRYLLDHAATPAASLRGKAVHVDRPLDLEAMAAALTCLPGEHDFSAFAGAGHEGSTVRFCTEARLERQTLLGRELVAVVLSANAFLRHMVRNLVGTLLLTGLGKCDPARFAAILAAGDRRDAGPTAPAHGLYLETISYDPAFAPLQMSERWDHLTYWRPYEAAPRPTRPAGAEGQAEEGSI
ncbi:MAG TPA: tRNA pseudouridine(38-40) synthase TruA [Herpetosiphonaceae bacterium]